MKNASVVLLSLTLLFSGLSLSAMGADAAPDKGKRAAAGSASASSRAGSGTAERSGAKGDEKETVEVATPGKFAAAAAFATGLVKKVFVADVNEAYIKGIESKEITGRFACVRKAARDHVCVPVLKFAKNHNRIASLAKTAVVAGVVYGAYKLYQKFTAPKAARTVRAA